MRVKTLFGHFYASTRPDKCIKPGDRELVLAVAAQTGKAPHFVMAVLKSVGRHWNAQSIDREWWIVDQAIAAYRRKAGRRKAIYAAAHRTGGILKSM